MKLKYLETKYFLKYFTLLCSDRNFRDKNCIKDNMHLCCLYRRNSSSVKVNKNDRETPALIPYSSMCRD